MNLISTINFFFVFIFNFFGFIKLIKPLNYKKYIICNKNNFINTNFLKDKKTISISPAGYYGFYVMGICAYIKDNYDTSKYVFSGASAGAWNSLFMIMNINSETIKNIIVKNEIYKNKNIYQIQKDIKQNILQNFNTENFDLNRLFIGVTIFKQTNIYTDFESIDDAIDCCLASSHIPFITGGLLYLYKNKYVFDGGFSENPYLDINQIVLHIHPNIWGQNEKMKFNLFKKDYFNFENLYKKGYEDTFKYGKETLDKIFINNT